MIFSSLQISICLISIGLHSAVCNAAYCPFCVAQSPTIRQNIEQADAVAVVKLIDAESETLCSFEIVTLVKGSSEIIVGERIKLPYSKDRHQNEMFLVFGTTRPEGILAWTSPTRLSGDAHDYLLGLIAPENQWGHDRLRYSLNHLFETDALISRDVFDEFALASYSEMEDLKELYDRAELRKQISDPTVPASQKKLYLMMLGICGNSEDEKFVEGQIDKISAENRDYLDAIIACYLKMAGESALSRIEEKLLRDTSTPHEIVLSAIAAIRFHGTEGGSFSRERLAKSYHLLLDRPKLANAIISDLSRWEDWTQVESMEKLFRDAEKGNYTWLRIPVFRYLMTCPQRRANELVDEFKSIDPTNFYRAKLLVPAIASERK